MSLGASESLYIYLFIYHSDHIRAILIPSPEHGFMDYMHQDVEDCLPSPEVHTVAKNRSTFLSKPELVYIKRVLQHCKDEI